MLEYTKCLNWDNISVVNFDANQIGLVPVEDNIFSFNRKLWDKGIKNNIDICSPHRIVLREDIETKDKCIVYFHTNLEYMLKIILLNNLLENRYNHIQYFDELKININNVNVNKCIQDLYKVLEEYPKYIGIFHLTLNFINNNCSLILKELAVHLESVFGYSDKEIIIKEDIPNYFANEENLIKLKYIGSSLEYIINTESNINCIGYSNVIKVLQPMLNLTSIENLPKFDLNNILHQPLRLRGNMITLKDEIIDRLSRSPESFLNGYNMMFVSEFIICEIIDRSFRNNIMNLNESNFVEVINVSN